MDEMSFDYDRDDLAEASRRFPAHRLTTRPAHPNGDLRYLSAPGTDFARHAWDEGGHS